MIVLLQLVEETVICLFVLIALSATCDTTDHDILFCIIEKYAGIRGNAIKL